MNEYLGKNYKVNLYSSVFVSLKYNNPSIVIYSEEKCINITSKYEYNLKRYYNNNLNLIAEINDYDKVLEIYEICASSYTTTDEYKISKLIDLLNNKKLIKE